MPIDTILTTLLQFLENAHLVSIWFEIPAIFRPPLNMDQYLVEETIHVHFQNHHNGFAWFLDHM